MLLKNDPPYKLIIDNGWDKKSHSWQFFPSISPDIPSKILSLKWPLFPCYHHFFYPNDDCHFPGPQQLLSSFPPCIQSCPTPTHNNQMTFFDINQVILARSPLMASHCICTRIQTCYHCLQDPESSTLACLSVLISHHPPQNPCSSSQTCQSWELLSPFPHQDFVCLFPLPPTGFPHFFTGLFLILQISAALSLPWPPHSPPHSHTKSHHLFILSPSSLFFPLSHLLKLIITYLFVFFIHPSPPLDCKIHEGIEHIYWFTTVSSVPSTMPNKDLSSLCWMNEQFNYNLENFVKLDIYVEITKGYLESEDQYSHSLSLARMRLFRSHDEKQSQVFQVMTKITSFSLVLAMV